MFSKTNYTDGAQCPKMLWMQRNMPYMREVSDEQSGLLESGAEVGALAREWAGEHVLVEQDHDYVRMAAQTSAALSAGKTVCEATFTDGVLVCMADVCKPRPDGSVDVMEVKATTKVKPYHVIDLAFQVLVAEKCGFRVASASIVHLDGDYRLDGALDLDALFAVDDRTAEAREATAGMERRIAELLEARDAEAEPETEIGRQCNSPHACPFQKWCWRDVPADSVFTLAGVGRLRGLKHWREGRRTYADALAGEAEGSMKLNGLQRAQAQGGERFDAESVGRFLGTLHYPLYFLDFETVQPAVPAYQGTKAYQQVPTQFSLHWVDEPGGPLHHAEYLAPSAGDPRRGVAEHLVAAIPDGACVTAYNMSFEKGRIKELADHLPDLADRLMGIHGSMADLMTPFKSGWAYLPAMQGSYSIKKVLPALYPDDPELDYARLEGIRDGGAAMRAYKSLAELPPEREAAVRGQLLRYCELDTLAMVRVWEWLEGRLGLSRP